MRFLLSLLATACVLITAPTSTDAHTWLECTKVLNPDARKSGQALQCAGNMRGHNGRQPGQSVDNRYTNRIFAHDGSKPACKPDSQGSKNWYFPGFPRARVQPGERVAVSYNTNGHTNRDSPLTQSTYAFYWTGNPNVQLTTMSQLTPENRLTPLQNYDDCFAGEAGAGFTANPARSNSFNIPGVGYYTIPKGTPDGVYQIVWHWSYDKRFPNNFNQEEYTSCFDVIVGNAPDLPYNAFYTAGGPEESNQQSPRDDRTDPTYNRGTREFPKWVSQGTPFWSNNNIGRRAKELGLTAADVSYPNMQDFCRDTPRLPGMVDIGTNTQGAAPAPQPQPQPPAPQPNPQPQPQPPAQPQPQPIPPVIPSPGVMAGPSQSFMDGNIRLTLSTGLIGGCQSPAVSFALRTNTGTPIEYLNVIHQYGGVDRGSACSRSGSFQTITCIKEGGIPGARTEIYIVYKIAGRGENIWPRPTAQGRVFTTVPVSCAENAKDGIRALSEAEFLADEGVLVEDNTISETSSLNLPLVIGIAVGGTALIILAIAGIVVYRKRQQSQVHTAHTTRDIEGMPNTTTMV